MRGFPARPSVLHHSRAANELAPESQVFAQRALSLAWATHLSPLRRRLSAPHLKTRGFPARPSALHPSPARSGPAPESQVFAQRALSLAWATHLSPLRRRLSAPHL